MDEKSKVDSYIIRNYIPIPGLAMYLSTMSMMIVMAYDMFQDGIGEAIPLSYGHRILLILNFFLICGCFLFIIVFIKLKIKPIEGIEEKISFLEQNKPALMKKIYSVSLLTVIVPLIVIGNSLLDSGKIKNIPCRVSSKDFTEEKKIGFTYFINFKCQNLSTYKMKVSKDKWEKVKNGDNIVIGIKSGAFGLERVKNVSY